MNDKEKLDAIRQHITKRLDYLERLVYHHDCNIPEPDLDQQNEYLFALGEQKALRAVRRVLEGGKP